MKFKSKPMVIDAEQYREGLSAQDLADIGVCTGGCVGKEMLPHVHTMHENQTVFLKLGDWVVPEPDGEHFYPIDNEVFQRKYEPHV